MKKKSLPKIQITVINVNKYNFFVAALLSPDMNYWFLSVLYNFDAVGVLLLMLPIHITQTVQTCIEQTDKEQSKWRESFELNEKKTKHRDCKYTRQNWCSEWGKVIIIRRRKNWSVNVNRRKEKNNTKRKIK